MTKQSERERFYRQALQEIASYDSAEWLRRNCEKNYGLSYEEALEMAYDNIREEAKFAIRQMRAPKAIGKTGEPATKGVSHGSE